ncbi:MAG: TonB-dependent receptor [Cytophagaceae bacterium SCN 52-12]|nr:MAG: TonB-dependent receptor [Cytophagaceae bacterium SCN 52-12]
MKYLSVLISICLSIANIAHAQQTSVITGRLLDHHTGLPLPYGSVALYPDSASTAALGILTGEDGSFRFAKVTAGRYRLVAQYVGYRNATIQINTSELTGMPLEVLLEPAVTDLNAVEVRGAAGTIENQIDRTVIRADRFFNTEGSTALDVLRNTPSVTVNSVGEISWRGSNAFMVLIDGKPIRTDPQYFLAQLPANSIRRIEMITSPSARYDPDGKGGIINIVTRSGAAGTSFQANLQGGLPSVDRHANSRTPVRFGGDLVFNHRQGKWEINAGGNYLRNDMAGHRSGDVNTTIGGIFTSFPSEGERSFMRYSYTGRASVTFTPDSANTWSVGFYSGYRMQSRRADIVYNNLKTRISDGSVLGRITYFNSNVAEKSSRIDLLNLDYTRTFKNKSAVTLSALAEKAGIESLTYNLNLNEPGRNVVLQNTQNPGTNPLAALRMNADYLLPLKNGNFETGYQYRYQEQKGDFKYLSSNGSGGFELVPEFSSKTKVLNEIHSVYSQYSAKKDRLEYSGGIRYEYAKRTFNAAGQPARFLNLSNLFPSASLQYKISSSLQAKAGYNRRIQRSTNHELNPYPEREHSETLESGDPDILPELIDLSEAGIISRFDKGSLSATVYNQRIKNVVNRVNSVYNDTIINRIYTNAGLASSWGIEITGQANPAAWWQLMATINAYHYKIKGSIFNETVKVNTSGPVYSVNANTTFKITPTFQLQWYLNYLSKRITAQGEDSRFVLAGFSARKTFLKGRIVSTLQWQNLDLGMLKSNRQRITTSGKDFFTTTNYIHETDMILLNLSYSFNQLPKRNRLPKSEFGDREF